jgi:creatinine amidohydrolase
MTEFFSFDEMTWPEISELPRDTCLIIQLGDGYSPNQLAEMLGRPEKIGMLPPIPYGWYGSGLRIPEKTLDSYLANLLNSLRDDGFPRSYILTPPGLNWSIESSRLVLPPVIAPGDYPEPGGPQALPPDSGRGKVVIIPIGHTEQHGFHLPLSTDTLIIQAIAQGTAAAVPDQAVTLPVFPYGVSTHRQAFAGTLNAGGRAFEDFFLAVIDVLVERGFDRFYFISGHGGNCSFLSNVVKYAGERHRRIFCATAWLYLSGPEGIAALEKHRRSPIGGMGHACELETSLILHLRPELVKMELAVDEMNFIATPSYYMDWVEGGALIANPPWDDDTVTGAYGAGSLADASNGALWLQTAISEKVTHIHEIHTQHIRREARRVNGFGLWGKER